MTRPPSTRSTNRGVRRKPARSTCSGACSPFHERTRGVIAWATIVCLALSSGCAGWRTVSREEMVREVHGYHPTSVRLLYADSTLEVRDPSVRGDSLVGTAWRWGSTKPVSIALTSVDSASVRGTVRKPAMFLAIPIAAFTLVAVITALTDEDDVVPTTNP